MKVAPDMLLRAKFHAVLLATITIAFACGQASAADGLNPSQKKDVEKVVQDYILKNPEILMRAIQEYQIRQRITERERAKKSLVTLGPDLHQNKTSPVIGNPNGDVTIVEFFDYRCGYCKRVFPTIQALLKEDGNIRYVLKEYPILGPDSLIASQASLAVWEQEPKKYLPLHTALMKVRGQLNQTKILNVARKLGINTDMLQKGMKGVMVRGELNKNMELAEALGISGTPAFVIGQQLVPGAISKEELKKLIATARKG